MGWKNAQAPSATAANEAEKLPQQSSNNVNIDAESKTIEEIYQRKTQLEHILLRPDTYIGSIEKHKQNLWVYDEFERKMVYKEVNYVPGLYKIFDEILVNAADNKQRDPRMRTIKVNIDVNKNCISVYNDGNGVPVEIHQKEGVYVPELIFGHLLTSSNYDDNVKKTTGGRNGYGAKLTNIFSTEFIIETADGKGKKKYKQVFSNNMGNKSQPVIGACKSGENWTKVTFKPDLTKFRMEQFEDDVVALMKKRVVDMSGCLGKTVDVFLNGHLIPIKTFKEYCKLYLPADLKSVYSDVDARWQVCVSESEGQFQQVSFVNGIATIKGGTHVDCVSNQITTYLLGKNKHKYANLKPHNVKSHLWVFVNALIDNPAFDSQTKETLTLRQSNFGTKCELSYKFLMEIETKTGVVENILSWVNLKNNMDLKKTDGTKASKVHDKKLEDANLAGKTRAHECTLILTEGDSAKALAMAGLSVVGRDRYGVFPLRGKLLNVREATHTQLKNNVEIAKLKAILGLKQGIQYDSVKPLRYGRLMLMTDQDHDGSHIKGLIINFIHAYWPSLLKIPSFLVEFITPIVKATHRNGKVLSFYTMPEYESWKESLGGNANGWSIKYYKGLGTSTSEEGKEYFQAIDSHRKDFVWVDEQDGESIELAFSKKKIEARKMWLRQFKPGTYLDHKEKRIRYSDFINKELILFSVADLQRSIPSMVDGFKPGQRKIIFSAFKRYFVQEAKVAQFSGYVSEHSAYHHGEQSLAGTIIGMAQNFVGSNNIHFFEPKGQFGSRSMGGKDCANARYIFTKLCPITRYLFPKDDDVLLDYLKEDGQSIEPVWYIPIIPMVLVNGSEGIGTGWSSYIPNYNPRDIIANLRRLMNKEPLEPIHPWYRGFSGTIEKTSMGVSYTVNGIIQEVDERTLRITELPLRRWTIEDYKEFLESMLEWDANNNEPFIEDLVNYSDQESVHFEVKLSAENMELAKQEGLLKKFKLTTTISTSNMHLFDAQGAIKKYDTPEQITEEFFNLRLEFYEKRKLALVKNLETELLKLENKVKFILEVVEGSIIVSNRKRADLLFELKEKGYTPFPMKVSVEAAVAGSVGSTPEDAEEEPSGVINLGIQASDYNYLLSMSIWTLTIEKVQQLLAERDKMKEDVAEMKRATPRALWMKDLEALEKKLDEEDKEHIKNQKKSVEFVVKRSDGGAKAERKAPKKNNLKPKNTETTAEAMDISTDSVIETDVPEMAKSKGRAGTKKAPAVKGKSSSMLKDEEDDFDVLNLRQRLAAYNFSSSPETSDATGSKGTSGVQVQQKEPRRTAAAHKKPLSSVVEISDDDDDDNISNDDFELEEITAQEAKKGARKAVNNIASKPPAAAAVTKKRGPANKHPEPNQKLIAEVLTPAKNAGISPEKKVRKIRESPFNKKSGSVLGRAGFTEKELDLSDSADEMELILHQEAQKLPAKCSLLHVLEPREIIEGRTTYALSSESDEAEDDEDFDRDVNSNEDD